MTNDPKESPGASLDSETADWIQTTCASCGIGMKVDPKRHDVNRAYCKTCAGPISRRYNAFLDGITALITDLNDTEAALSRVAVRKRLQALLAKDQAQAEIDVAWSRQRHAEFRALLNRNEDPKK